MRTEILALDPSTYQPHYLHGSSRVWAESNCALDMWIEALHALNYDPTAALACILSVDFDGTQWRMIKFPPEDLRALFGIEFDEMNVWMPLAHHITEQLELGRFVTIDVDAIHLPDTADLTYRSVHQKTTVMMQMIDVAEHRCGYFHNGSYFELDGADFDALVMEDGQPVGRLPPYVESVRLDGLIPAGPHVRRTAVELARSHIARRPLSNPIEAMSKRLAEDFEWLTTTSFDVFHRYAFATIRQCGACAELAASFCLSLSVTPGDDLSRAGTSFTGLAEGMKGAEFMLARAVRKGTFPNIPTTFSPLAEAWETAMAAVVTHCEE
jgi:hypothetical protein